MLGRQDDFLDEGVAAIFGVAGGEAELLGLCFHARKFTSVEAKTWLSERGFAPLVSFRTQAGIAAQDFDATLECLKLKTSDPKPVAHR